MDTHHRQVAAFLALLSLLTASIAWGEVVGKTAQPLDGKPARLAEATLGDLVTDAARAAFKPGVTAEIALVQASQIRPDTLPAGDLTREALVNSLLFPNEQVVLVEMPGRMIAEVLEKSLSYLPRPSASFLQVSGLTVTYRPGEAVGRRVTEIKVGEAALSPDKIYQVAMPNSLAKGALVYYRVFGELKVKQVGKPLGDTVVSYAQANPNLLLIPGQRLRDLSQTSPGSGKE